MYCLRKQLQVKCAVLFAIAACGYLIAIVCQIVGNCLWRVDKKSHIDLIQNEEKRVVWRNTYDHAKQIQRSVPKLDNVVEVDKHQESFAQLVSLFPRLNYLIDAFGLLVQMVLDTFAHLHQQLNAFD